MKNDDNDCNLLTNRRRKNFWKSLNDVVEDFKGKVITTEDLNVRVRNKTDVVEIYGE